MPERLITLKEAAERFGISYPQLAYLARTDRLKAWRFKHRLLTTEGAVAAYVNDTEARSHDPLKYQRG